MVDNPHLLTNVHFLGPSPEEAGVATVLIHGRNQQPSDMFDLANRIALDSMPYIALQAANSCWYPNRFMARTEDNQPSLDFALDRVDVLIKSLERMGIKREKIAIMGFSQGACLACEYVYRNAQRYGGLIALTGGLIGPDDMSWPATADLANTPILMGNGDQDEWVPLHRTTESAQVFKDMGGDVQLKVFPDRPHLVTDEEIDLSRALLQRLLLTQKNTA